MSRTLLESVMLVRGLPAVQKSVLIVLAGHAHHDGTNARPSQQTISELSGLPVRNVQRGLHDLEAAGRIVPERYNGGGRGHAVQYTIRLDALGINPATIAAFRPRNPANMADFNDTNPAKKEPKPRQNNTQTPPKKSLNPANMAYQSGKNHPFNQKEESEESANAPSAFSFENFSDQMPERNEQLAEVEAAVIRQHRQKDLAPFSDQECEGLIGLEDVPCPSPRRVLHAFCRATEQDSPMRAWAQYVDVFLEMHSTPAEIITGYRLMQAQFANYEHKPGIKSLAQHWDEWRSKAKSRLAADRAYRNIRYIEEPTDEERAAIARSLRRSPWHTVQDTLREQRVAHVPRSYEDLPDIWNPPTPEELAERDAKRAARWQENLASMRAATASHEEETAVS